MFFYIKGKTKIALKVDYNQFGNLVQNFLKVPMNGSVFLISSLKLDGSRVDNILQRFWIQRYLGLLSVVRSCYSCLVFGSFVLMFTH